VKSPFKLIFCGALLLAGCSTESSHRWLVFFFDGVDPVASATATNAPASSSPANATASAATPAPVKVVYYHQPYAERKCAECHAGTFSQKLRMPVAKLCFECHRNKVIAGKYIHSPVEAGDCQSCHHQHSSTQPHLLVRAGQALCTECHDKADMVKAKGHETMGAALCQSCHNPHSSNVKRFVKAP
jgi:predicted CXXCH cytochrome family protein